MNKKNCLGRWTNCGVIYLMAAILVSQADSARGQLETTLRRVQEETPTAPAPVEATIIDRLQEAPLAFEEVEPEESSETVERVIVKGRVVVTPRLPQPVAAMQFSPDGELLAVAMQGPEILVWDVGGMKAVERHKLLLSEQPNGMSQVAFSQDGTHLAAADARRVWLWSLEDGKLVNSLQLSRNESRITRLVFSNGELLVVDQDEFVSRLNSVTLEPLADRPSPFGDVRAISADGRFCVRTSPGLRLSVWDLVERRVLPLRIPTCKDDLFTISVDGKRVGLAGVDWDGRKRDQGPPQDAAAAPDNGDEGAAEPEEKGPWDTIDGGIWWLDTETGEKQVFRRADGRRIHRLQFAPDGSYLGVAYADLIDFTYQGDEDISIRRHFSISRDPEADDTSVTPSQVALGSKWPPRVAWQKNDREVDVKVWSIERVRVRRDDRAMMREYLQAAPQMEFRVKTPPEPYFEYTVFYGTNRKPRSTDRPYWLDVLIDFVRDELGLLLAAVCGIVLVFSTLAFAILRALTSGRMVGLVFLVLLIYAGSAGAHTMLVLRNDPTKPGDYFGNERGELSYGSVQVTIPNKHKYGELEGPIWFLSKDPEKHITLHQVDAAEGRLFLERLQSEFDRAKSPRGREAFVFIHGYNVSFEDAARRTAQMAYDLNFEGVPLFFSWPSKASVFGYLEDANNSDLSGVQLHRFLSDIEKYSGASKIHLIAHSMGTRVLANALRDMGPERLDRSSFREIILAAPDIDAEYFRNGIAPALVPQNPGEDSRRVTVYASSADKALQISQQVNGYPRAGDARTLVMYPGLDTIDVSDRGEKDREDVTGHSYYGNLPDLFELLRTSKPARERGALIARSDRELPYWVHDPKAEILRPQPEEFSETPATLKGTEP